MESAIEHSLEVLGCEEAFAIPDRKSRRKWSGPWWHMATLYEMDEAERIPVFVVEKALDLLRHGTWPKFVITKEDAPKKNKDRSKMDCCHCELGVFYMILSKCGCNVDAEIPWMREWFLKHQLPDGGLNCTPSAYLGSRKSSIVSTLPPLEAVLLFTERRYTGEEERFLDEGARYLIEHRLVRSKSDGAVINDEWLKPFFPRFFEYDILRGLPYLVEWSRRRGVSLPSKVIKEGLHHIKGYIKDSGIVLGRHVNDKNGDRRGSTFPLLKSVSKVGKVLPYLIKQLGVVLAAVG